MKVKNCARCGLDHHDLELKKFTRPFAPSEAFDPVHGQITWTHWMTCPTNGEPILVCYVSP